MSEDGSPTAWSAPTLGATDADSSDTLTWSVSSEANHGTATVSGTGASPSTFTYAPEANWHGSDAFTVEVSDGNGGTDTISVDVTVESVNDAPAITQGAGPLSATMSQNGSPKAWSAPTLDAADVDTSDTLTWSVSLDADHGTATVSGTGASPSTFTYEPETDWYGSDSFTVQVSDGNGGTDAIEVDVTVENSTPSVTEWPTASAILHGHSLADSTLSGGTASVAGTFAFDSPTTVPPAGSYSAAVTFTPDDTANYNPVSGTVNVTVNAPAAITLDPASRTVDAGASVSLWVNATGTAPLHYQWKRDGVNIPGATSTAHGIPSAQLPDQGSYQCRVWNDYGDVLSAAATLVVHAAPLITRQSGSRTVDAGTNLHMWVVAEGSDTLHYQWKLNGTNIPGATAAAHGVSPAQLAQQGSYECRVWNDYGDIVSTPADLVVHAAPTITRQCGSCTVAPGANLTLWVVASGSDTMHYQWKRNGANIPGATAAAHGIPSAQLSNEGSYTCRVWNDYGETTSGAVAVTVQVAPVITRQSGSSTVDGGDSVTEWVVAQGSGTLRYQWRLNGTNIPGATAAAHGIPSAQVSDEGSYTCRVWNDYGEAISDARTLVVHAAPLVVTQPKSITVVQWSPLESVWTKITGSAPLHYQWRKEGVNIPGATSTAHGIRWVQPSDAGNYACYAWNDYGDALTQEATITVTPATTQPIILTEPRSVTANPGSQVYFWVSAIGTPTLRYQWTLDGVNINGAVSSAHGILNAQAVNEGTYRCRVYNDYGEVATEAATLTIGTKK